MNATRSPLMDRPLPLHILTGTRTTFALLTLFAPRIGARLFRMEPTGPAVVMARMFGIRTLVFAAALMRLHTISTPRVFLGINVLVDLADACAFILSGRRREISSTTTVLGVSAALSGATLSAAGLAALSQRDAP